MRVYVCVRERLSFQVTIFYGKRSNAEFLIHNGFVCRDNIRDAVDIKLGLPRLCRLLFVR